MKFLKWFSLFFVSLGLALFVGMAIGFRMEQYFYPREEDEYIEAPIIEKESAVIVRDQEDAADLQVVAVSGKEERIHTNTQYICIERDMLSGEEVVIRTQLPQMYVGLNREQFIDSIKEYEKNPPLGERERGLVSVEVRRFSTEEVEVLMNYKYVKPSESFYIIVFDDEIRVLLDDKQTVYLETGIRAPELPMSLQQEIMQGMFVPSEEALYDFLENYTS